MYITLCLEGWANPVDHIGNVCYVRPDDNLSDYGLDVYTTLLLAGFTAKVRNPVSIHNVYVPRNPKRAIEQSGPVYLNTKQSLPR